MGQRSDLILKARGLFITSDPLSEVPNGSLRQAINVDIDQNGLIEPRRGYERLQGSLEEIVNKLYCYKGRLLAHRGSSTVCLHDENGSSWVDYEGTFSPLDAASPIRSAESNENLYLATSRGIQKLDDVGSSIVDAGIPQGLDLQAELTGVGTGFFAPDNQLAYRIVWGYRDANNNLILGAPSQRRVVTNPAGDESTADTVDIKSSIPAGITENHFYQIYRSFLSGSEDIEPNEELGLVYEANPTADEILGNEIAITDETPDALIGATIYTASSQEGLVNSNFQPPLAKDLALFKGHLFGANTKGTHEITINLLGVGGSLGLQVDDSVTIAGVTYSAKEEENLGEAEFKIFTDGTPASNIADTAQSLVKVINKYSSNTSVYAYYMSGLNDLPGEIRIVERDVGGFTFSVSSSRGGAWNPNLISAQSSTNDEAKNGLWYSKFQEPEAVPITNTLRVGNASSNILRIIPLRESLFIFTETGIYTLTGSDPSSFRIDLLDNTAKLLAPESAVTLQNQIYGLTDQGVVAVSDTGVELVSRPIESALLRAFGTGLDSIKTHSFAIGYESDRKYMLFIPEGGASNVSICYVYNTITNNWTSYSLRKKAGIVNPVDDKLYLSDSTTPLVSKERKSYSFRDQVDEDIDVIVSNVEGRTLTLNTVTGMAIGDLYYENDNVFGVIESIDTPSLTMVISRDLGFSTGNAKVLKHFNTTIEWNPLLGGAPSLLKQFSEIVLIANRDINSAYLTFSTDVSFNEEAVFFKGGSVDLWGLFPWGEVLWGGISDVQHYRTYIPRRKQRGGLLRIKFTENAVYNDFQISGLRLTYRQLGERISR